MLQVAPLFLLFISIFGLAFAAVRGFKFKDALTKIIEAATDPSINETEFQSIVTDIKKDIYGV